MYNLIINWQAWFSICFGISNNCGGVWWNEVGQNKETDEELGKDCVEEGFPLARVKLDRDGGGGRQALVMGNFNINISVGPELKLA